jgi:hypothetical protein
MSDSEDGESVKLKGKGSKAFEKKSKSKDDVTQAKAKKKKGNDVPKEIYGKTPEEIADDEEAKRLKKKAESIGVFCKRRETNKQSLRPSSVIRKHTQNKPVEIFKKALARRNKALFLFPGLVSLSKEGKFGQLSNMQKNPVLDIEFPNGVLKLKGTRINTKQKFLTIQPKARRESFNVDIFLKIFISSKAAPFPAKNTRSSPCADLLCIHFSCNRKGFE